MRVSKLSALLVLGAVAAAACSDAKSNPSLFADGPSPSGTGGSGGQGESGGAGEAGSGGAAGGSSLGGSGGGINLTGGSGGGVTPGGLCPNIPNDDHDGDGWTEEQGDCNDCDANVNPGAIDIKNYVLDGDGNPTTEVASEQIDEDCDGAPYEQDEQPSCDTGLGIAFSDPFDAAKAMGLCNVHVEENPADPKQRKWGVLDAKFSTISGGFLSSPPQMSAQNVARALGILPNFGPATVPQEGAAMFGLSSGTARVPGMPDYEEPSGVDNGTGQLGFPPGFPKQGTCASGPSIGAYPHDGIAIDLRIRAPTNAKSFSFNFRFFTYEYPNYACSQYFDIFAVLMEPYPADSSDPMWPNIAFETTQSGVKNVIGVNNQSFLVVCDRSVQGYNCSQGGGDLQGTGFEGHGASAWLATQAPVAPGSIVSLRLAIWDTADQILDSSAVVDNFKWGLSAGTGVGTVIIPDPK